MVEAPTGRHSALFINFIKGRFVFYRRPCVCCDSIIEAINSDSFREFPDADKLVVVVPLNPISKHFPTISNLHPHGSSSKQPYPTTLCYPELLQRNI